MMVITLIVEIKMTAGMLLIKVTIILIKSATTMTVRIIAQLAVIVITIIVIKITQSS